MAKQFSFISSKAFLLLFAVVMCGWGIHAGKRLGDHESINAQCARQAIEDGDWLIPQFQNQERVRKSPLGIWLIAISSLVVDGLTGSEAVSDFAARLPQAIAAVLNVFVVAWLAGRMFGRRAGRLAGFICASSVATIYFSHSALIEMTLTLFITSSFACFWRACEEPAINRKWLIAFYAAFAMAMMAKMPLPLMIVAPPLFVYWVFIRPVFLPHAGDVETDTSLGQRVTAQLKAIPSLLSIPGILVFLTICGAWPLYIYANVDDVLSLWQAEYMGRFSGEMADRSQPFWYYIPIVFGFVAPFALFFSEGVASFFLKPYARHKHALGFLLAWGVWGLIFLSASSFKRPHYVASIIPPFLLLIVPVVDRLFFDALAYPKRVIQVFCDLCTIAVIALLVVAAVKLRDQDMVSPTLLYTVLGLIAFCWCGSAIAYRVNRRSVSLALLLLSGPVMLYAGWSGAESMDAADKRIEIVTSALSEIGVTADDRVVSVDGRVDARFPFYADQRIERLFTPVEVSTYRTSRKEMPVELLQAAATRMEELIASNPRTFFLMDSQRFDFLKGDFDISVEELARVNLTNKKGGKSWVILGQGDAVKAGRS
ncbi:MAG: phospholipid carrier-dependent glycosyltransferase [Planctomycetes bacterium]|nr:phospholipid carrier-dependent glycosyltransferase [Planctomycetota bacterium]